MRPTSSHTIAVAALVALVASAACGDKREPPPEPPPPPPAVTGLDAVPGDATAVLGLDARALAESSLVAQVVAPLFAGEPELVRRIRGVLSACAIDPARDLEQVLFATGGSPSQALMVVDGALDASRLPACVAEAVAASGGSVQTRSEAPRAVWSTRRQDGSAAVWFAMGAPRTLVASISEPWLDAALAAGGKLGADEGTRAVLARIDRGAPAWLFVRVDPQLASRLAGLSSASAAATIRYVFGHLRVGAGVEIELAAVLPSASDAAASAEFARAQLEPLAVMAQGIGLGGLVSGIRVEFEKDTVFLRLTLSAQELKETLSQIDRAAGGE